MDFRQLHGGFEEIRKAPGWTYEVLSANETHCAGVSSSQATRRTEYDIELHLSGTDLRGTITPIICFSQNNCSLGKKIMSVKRHCDLLGSLDQILYPETSRHSGLVVDSSRKL
jgi:hypothetical protein